MSQAEDRIHKDDYPAIRARIEDRSIPVPECGCWLWLGCGDKNGYGSIGVGYPSKQAKAHRVSFIVFRNEFPGDLHVLHKCDTPACVNPDHLFLRTNQVNLTDMVAKGRSKAGRGKYPYGVRKQHRKYGRPDTPPRYEVLVKQGKKDVYLGAYATIEEAATVAASARDAWLLSRGIIRRG